MMVAHSRPTRIPTHILVVDDEPDIPELIRTKFRKQIRKNELNFLFATDGKDALTILEQTPAISIVLTDLNMPRMDGITLLRHLRDGFQGHAIIITAYGDYDRLRAAMNEGAFDFLSKPIDFDDLDKTLARAMHKHTHLQARINALEAENQRLQQENQRLRVQLANLTSREQ